MSTSSLSVKGFKNKEQSHKRMQRTGRGAGRQTNRVFELTSDGRLHQPLPSLAQTSPAVARGAQTNEAANAQWCGTDAYLARLVAIKLSRGFCLGPILLLIRTSGLKTNQNSANVSHSIEIILNTLIE